MADSYETVGVPANNNDKEGDSLHTKRVLERLRALGLITAENKMVAKGAPLTVLELSTNPALAPDRMHTLTHTGTLEDIEMTGYGDTFTDGRIVLRNGESTTGIIFSRVHSLEKA